MLLCQCPIAGGRCTSLESSLVGSRIGSRGGSLAEGVLLAAVKPRCAKLAEFRVIAGGLDTPFRSLFDDGLSCNRAGSDAVGGAGEERGTCVGMGGTSSMLPGPAGYSDLSDFLGLPFRLTGNVL